DDGAGEAPVQVDDLARVVAVAVRHRDRVDALGLPLGVGAGGPAQPWVEVDALAARSVEPERGVAEPRERSSHEAPFRDPGGETNAQERPAGRRRSGSMLRRFAPLAPMLAAAGADGAGAHRIAFYVLLLAVPAAVVAGLDRFAAALDGQGEARQAVVCGTALGLVVLRSEERRVGKECRARWEGEEEVKKRAADHGV